MRKIIKNLLKYKLIIKTQQRHKCKRHNAVTEEIDKMGLSSNEYNQMNVQTSSNKWQRNIINWFKKNLCI